MVVQVRYVILMGDGRDFHDLECDCGTCLNGKSYGCRIMDVSDYPGEDLFPNGGPIDEEISDALLEGDPLDVAYGCSPEIAALAAEGICLAQGWIVLPEND